MSVGLVVDASMAVGWVHQPQQTELSARLLDELLLGAAVEAPAVWPLEVAHTLLLLQRRDRLREPDRAKALARLKTLPVTIDHEGVLAAWSTLSDLALAYGLSVYDAAYLELAQRRNLALATRDKALAVAARAAGVQVWE